MKELLEIISQNTGIKATQASVLRVLRSALTRRNVWEVIELADQPFNLTAEILKQLEASGYLSFHQDQVVLTKEGLGLCQEKRITAIEDYSCPACEGSGVSFDSLRDVYQRFQNIAKKRPKPIPEYDQGVLTSPSVFRRVVLMSARGDVRGKKIAILGDDDLVSIALGLTGLPQSILLFEVDKRLTDFIREVSSQYDLPIELITMDLRERLPERVVGSCDTFLTDPPEAIPGLLLFIERGLGTLRAEDGHAGYFGLTLTESSLGKWRDFQRALLDRYKVVITDILHDFSSYENWDFLLETIRDDLPPLRTPPKGLWYRSSFYRIETMPGFSPINEECHGGDIYMDEEMLVFSKLKGKT